MLPSPQILIKEELFPCCAFHLLFLCLSNIINEFSANLETPDVKNSGKLRVIGRLEKEVAKIVYTTLEKEVIVYKGRALLSLAVARCFPI